LRAHGGADQCARPGEQLELGCVEEWGFKNGEKRVRIGQEMDGETNMVEGKIETWTEQWCKTLEADGRLARTTAEKVSLRPQCSQGVRRRSRLNE